MPKFALLLGGADLDKRAGNPAVQQQVYEQFMVWLSSTQRKGHRVDTYKLRDQSGARLSVRGGQVVEGPFMETKEAVGGVVFFEAEALEEAVAVARECPVIHLQNGYVEVRLVEPPRRPGSAG
jgi:hypothetical protein